jgi:hypothetical protein
MQRVTLRRLKMIKIKAWFGDWKEVDKQAKLT